MKRIAFYTLGCKVNQADTASMEAIFRSHGYTVVGFNCEADIYFIIEKGPYSPSTALSVIIRKSSVLSKISVLSCTYYRFQ